MENGIYFGMPDEQYHAIDRLSNTGLQRMRVSPATFWADSWLNPSPRELSVDQQRSRTMTRLIGRAYHCARLEPDQFHERYVRQLDKADFDGVAGFVAGGTDMGTQLKELGQAKTKDGEGVAGQALRLRAAGYAGPIWQLELAAWEDQRGEREAVPADVWGEILIDMARIRKVPAICKLLSGGAAEVVILYTCPDTGLPMKAKLDYLRPDSWSDFKTFANPAGKNLLRCILDAFKYNRLYMQAALYREAVELVRAGQLDVIGEATDEQHQLVEQIRLRPGELDCHFVFQEKGGVPNLLERKVQFYNLPPNIDAQHAGASDAAIARVEQLNSHRSQWFVKAQAEIRTAKRDFLNYSEIYPAGEEWRPWQPSGTITDEDFTPYWLDEAL